jgi:hypothetical protein
MSGPNRATPRRCDLAASNGIFVTGAARLDKNRAQGPFSALNRAPPRRIGTNTPHICSNAPHIDPNTPHIGSNSRHIGTNTAHIGSSAPRIDSNTAHIGPNAPRIGSNAPHIGSNPRHIGPLPGRIGSHVAGLTRPPAAWYHAGRCAASPAGVIEESAAMGFILLDLTFRAERAFNVRIPRRWVERLGIRRDGDDATLEQYHEFLLELCREQNVVPPETSWRVLIRVIEDASGADQKDLTPSTRLIKDIAPYG